MSGVVCVRFPAALCVVVAVILAAAGCSRPVPVEEVTVADPSAVDDLPEVHPGGGDWPWWRGPSGTARSVEMTAPITWSDSTNIVWNIEIPGRGHASPIVWGDRVFATTADENEQTQSLMCYDRSSGSQLWQTVVHQGGFMHKHEKNSHASATPACDGERVYTVFMVQDAIWVTAVDLDGNVVWQSEVAPFRSLHGYGSSPVLYKSLVIVAGDNPGGGFLAAVHRQTGKTIWLASRGNDASFGTPAIAHVAGRDQLLLSGQNRLTSYDPRNGRELWSVKGPATTTANTVAWNDQLVFASGGYPQSEILAARGDGSGKIEWQKNLKAYVPSPLLVDNRLFVVHDNGVARCFDAQTGAEIWTHRLGGDFSASPVLAAGHIYVPNEAGTMFVFKASDDFELVAENRLAEGGFASPVFSRGELILRTSQYLYCIGAGTGE